jgi:hypothetical protein
MVSLGLAFSLVLLGPPEEVIAPAGQAGEPAIAPAELPGDKASSKPVVQRPGEPAPEPAVEPEPGLPSYETEPPPVEPGDPVEPPPPSDDALPTWSEEPISEPLDDPWNAPDQPPAKLPGEPRRGVGLLVGGSLGFAVIFTRQWVTELMCTDVYCGFRGNLDRLVLLGSIGMIGGGAWMEGRHKGFMRDHEGKPMRPLLGRRAAGWTMFAVGLAGMITEAGLYMACYDGARGPFVDASGFSYTCRPAASVVMMDGSAVLSSVGFGLAMSAQSERREMTRKKAAKVVMLPYASADRAGLALIGRF